MTRYLLNNLYPAIQGEGVQTGVAMVIVRLHGCAVGCPWCDTKETWTIDPAGEVETIPAALGANARYTAVTAEAIVAYLQTHHPGPRWALITGGEPADQPLRPLVAALHQAGYQAALETSGTATGHLDAGFDWICVSPKLKLPGGKPVLPAVVAGADEIKHVVGKPADIAALDELLAELPLKPGLQICLQPVSQSPPATRLCIETVQQRGWRLSVQVHKYLDLP